MKVKVTLLALILICSISSMAQQKAYTKAEIDASNIIKFCNSVIELNNTNRASTHNYESMLSTATSNINKLQKNPNVQTQFVNYKNFKAIFGDQKNYDASYKTSPEFPEKKDIANTINVANSDINNAVKWATNISLYFSEKEYLTDTNFAKYPAMQDSLSFYFKKGYNGWSTASRLASKAGNNAELVLLAKSKIADFVIPMKSDLNRLKDIIELINQESPNFAQIKIEFTATTESMNKNKDLSTKDIKKLKDIYYKEVFQKFYTKAEQTLVSINKLTQELEENPKSDRLESMYSHLISNYKATVESYNTFISQ